jgi:hypothetical protein
MRRYRVQKVALPTLAVTATVREEVPGNVVRAQPSVQRALLGPLDCLTRGVWRRNVVLELPSDLGSCRVGFGMNIRGMPAAKRETLRSNAMNGGIDVSAGNSGPKNVREVMWKNRGLRKAFRPVVKAGPLESNIGCMCLTTSTQYNLRTSSTLSGARYLSTRVSRTMPEKDCHLRIILYCHSMPCFSTLFGYTKDVWHHLHLHFFFLLHCP